MNAFDYIDGQPIDLSNPNHRDVIIQRNKDLQNAVDNGLEIGRFYPKAKVTIRVTTEIQCLKCGKHIDEDTFNHLQAVEKYLFSAIPDVTCNNCGTTYECDQKNVRFNVVFPEQKTDQE